MAWMKPDRQPVAPMLQRRAKARRQAPKAWPHFPVARSRARIRQILYNWHMETVSVKLEKSGRILIPAAIRRELGLKEGSELLLRPNDAGLQVSTRQQAIKRVQAQLRKYAPRGRLLSQELLDERREEAARENAK